MISEEVAGVLYFDSITVTAVGCSDKRKVLEWWENVRSPRREWSKDGENLGEAIGVVVEFTTEAGFTPCVIFCVFLSVSIRMNYS